LRVARRRIESRLGEAGRLQEDLECRYNNRENPYMLRDAMLKLLLVETLPYKKLIED
jgi:hypothetical protein